MLLPNSSKAERYIEFTSVTSQKGSLATIQEEKQQSWLSLSCKIKQNSQKNEACDMKS